MKLQEIRPNLRIVADIESENPHHRMLRGIVIDVEDDSFTLLTDFGEVFTLSESQLLNHAVTQFPRIVSDVLQELRNEHEAINRLEEEIVTKRESILHTQSKLIDATFLSKFNMHGAKNRLMHSIPSNKLHFQSKETDYKVEFDSSSNDEIQMIITASNQIDYPQLDEVRDVERFLHLHGPNIETQLRKSFPESKKMKVLTEGVHHDHASFYNVKRTYELLFDVTRDNFLDFRESVCKGIELMKR